MTDEPDVGPLALAAFAAELLLIAALSVAGARLGGVVLGGVVLGGVVLGGVVLGGVVLGGVVLGGVVLGVLLPALLVALWAVLLAPRSTRRLDRGARVAVKTALACLGAGLLEASGLRWWALATLVVVGTTLVLPEVRERG